MIKLTRLQAGFTLVEILVVMGLLGLVLTVLAQMYFGNVQLYHAQTAELGINYSARLALDDIDAHVRQATRVLSAYDVYTTSPQVLIVEIQSINSSKQLIPGSYDVFVFELTGSEVRRYAFPDPASSRDNGAKLLATNVTELRFNYDNADYGLVNSVETFMSLFEQAGRETKSIAISSKSTLRN